MMTLKTLDLNDAQQMLSAARAKATEIGVPMCIAITDTSGQLIAFERTDVGPVTTNTIAIYKTFTASGAKKATHAYGDARQLGKPTHASSTATRRTRRGPGALPHLTL